MANSQDAGFLLTAVFDRKKELMNLDPTGSASIDPFYLLKEVAEMSNFRHQGNNNLTDQQYNKQQENLHGYNAMVMKNFDDEMKNSTTAGQSGYDPQSLAEKMSKFKFAKLDDNKKDQDWFKKLNTKIDDKPSQKVLKSGLTEEQELQIQREMIPQYIAKQQELQPEYEHIKNVGRELKQLKEEFGVVIKQVPPQATTSFMNRRGSQARQYELITSQMRSNRMQKMQARQHSHFNHSSQISTTMAKGIENRTNSQSRPRSIPNETPVRAQRGAQDNTKIMTTGLQSLSEASREHTYRDTPKNQSTSKKRLKKKKSKGKIRKTSVKADLNGDKQQASTIKSQSSDGEKQNEEDPISSYRKSENSKVCSKCGYYGCKGEQCDANLNESLNLNKNAHISRVSQTASNPVRKHKLAKQSSNKDMVQSSNLARLGPATTNGMLDNEQDGNHSPSNQVLTTEEGQMFRANAQGLIDIKQTEKLFLNQKLKPQASIKRDSDMTKSTKDGRLSLDSKTFKKQAQQKDNTIQVGISPRLDKKKAPKSSYLQSRKAAQQSSNTQQKDKSVAKKYVTNQPTPLPKVTQANAKIQFSLARKTNNNHFLSGNMSNQQIEKHNGTLNSKFKQLSSQVIMNFNESNSIQQHQNHLGHYVTQKTNHITKPKKQSKQQSITQDNRGILKKQFQTSSSNLVKPESSVNQRQSQLDQLLSMNKTQVQRIGGISAISGFESFQKKPITSNMTLQKIVGFSSNNTQLEGGYMSNSQRQSLQNIHDKVDLRKIITHHSRDLERKMNHKSEKLSKMDSRDQKSKLNHSQLPASNSVERKLLQNTNISYNFGQIGQMSMSNIKSKSTALYRDQMKYNNQDERIKEWHQNGNALIKQNPEIENYQDLSRDRMTKTIQNKTFDQKYNIDLRQKIQPDLKKNKNSKVPDELPPSRKMDRQEKEGNNIFTKRIVQINCNQKAVKKQPKNVDIKEIYQEIPAKRQNVLTPIKKEKPKSKEKVTNNLRTERNEISVDSTKIKKQVSQFQQTQRNKTFSQVSDTIFSGRKRNSKTDRGATSKEVQRQIHQLKKAEEIIYPQTVYCTSENLDKTLTNKIREKSANSLAQKKNHIINETMQNSICGNLDSSFERADKLKLTKSNHVHSLSFSPKGNFRIDPNKLKQRLNECQQIINEQSSGQRNEIIDEENETDINYQQQMEQERIFSAKSSKSRIQLIDNLCPMQTKNKSENKSNPYNESRINQFQGIKHRYKRSAYDSTIFQDRQIISLLSPIHEKFESRKRRTITFNSTLTDNFLSVMKNERNSKFNETAEQFSKTSDKIPIKDGEFALQSSLDRLTAEEKRLIDLSKMRKNIQDQKPNLSKITSNFHHSKFKMESKHASLMNNFQQSIDQIEFEEKQFALNENLVDMNSSQAHEQITLMIQDGMDEEKSDNLGNTISQINQIADNLNKSQTVEFDFETQPVLNKLSEGGTASKLEIQADQELQKINNLLKKKVKEKKNREKQLQDSIIHDKITQLVKNNKLSKREKNQLMFLKKLENKLVSKNEDVSSSQTSRRKHNKMIIGGVASSQERQVVGGFEQGLASSNNSFNNSITNNAKGTLHNLIFNDLRFQSELISILRKPKHTKDRGQTLTNIDQQKLLYGDEKTKRDIISTKGRNMAQTNSQQFKSKSVSTKKENKTVNNIKEILQNKKKAIRQNWEGQIDDQAQNTLGQQVRNSQIEASPGKSQQYTLMNNHFSLKNQVSQVQI